METKARVYVKQIETLADDWYILCKNTFDYLRNNGEWQSQAHYKVTQSQILFYIFLQFCPAVTAV